MTGELSKVIIRGYESPEENSQQGKVIGEYQAMFNPESFSVTNAFNYDESQALPNFRKNRYFRTWC